MIPWSRLLSNDLPRSRILAVFLIALMLALIVGPFGFTGAKSLSICVKILIFAVLAASFDLLLGYTGIVSFAHTVFFGIGAYGVSIAIVHMGANWSAVAIGTLAALLLSVVLAFLIGLFSLRVKAIFFSMITLALASAAQTLAVQLSSVTGGEDGIIFRLPPVLMPSFRLFDERVFGIFVDGRVIAYYLILVAVALMLLAILRIVNSPFGRVLLAIRDNEFRAEAIGYPVVRFRIISSVIAAVFACLCGALLSIWLRYAGPDAALSFEIMLDILIIVIIGGVGTIYGAVVGSAVFLFAQGYLQEWLKLAGAKLAGIPLLEQLLSPDRWMLWLGVFFILGVYYLPSGLVGMLRGTVAATAPIQSRQRRRLAFADRLLGRNK